MEARRQVLNDLLRSAGPHEERPVVRDQDCEVRPRVHTQVVHAIQCKLYRDEAAGLARVRVHRVNVDFVGAFLAEPADEQLLELARQRVAV